MLRKHQAETLLEKLLILTIIMGKNIALMPEGQLNAPVILQGQCQYMSWPWIHPPVIIHTHTAYKDNIVQDLQQNILEK